MDLKALVADIRTSTLGAGLLVLALVTCSHLALRWYLRRRSRRNAAPAADEREHSARQWQATTLLRLVAPLALMLWVQGLHYAAPCSR
jgi:hypothetical protein